MSTADDLPDDVVERAARTLFRNSLPGSCRLARGHLAALLDAGIVALVPDSDAATTDPCEECSGSGEVEPSDCVCPPGVECEGFCMEPCSVCKGTGQRPTAGWQVEAEMIGDGLLSGWWWWSLRGPDDPDGFDGCPLIAAGTEPTREEAEQAAEQARAAWDARLAGGAS